MERQFPRLEAAPQDHARAKQSDLTGMLYDDQTVLANDTISSTLTDCQLDEQATSFLRERGVTIDE